MTFLYALTLFLSAALLFSVQPMLGKMLLPLVGGAANGWLAALAFFQIALLLGYVIAHLAARLAPRLQVALTLGLMVLGVILLPVHLKSQTSLTGSAGVLMLLAGAVSLPYLALATVSSSLQRLYAHHRKREPYFLYAASNAGSLLGLLAYPLLVEPVLPLARQSWLWTALYALAGLLIAALLFLSNGKVGAVPSSSHSLVKTRQKIEWVIFAFLPASMSLSLTLLLTLTYGSLPLLWVLPLSLYLITFIIAFAKPWPQRRLVQTLPFLLVVAFIYFLLRTHLPAWPGLILLLAIFFTAALWCHQILAEKRPPEAGLTQYYAWLALGGALAGVFSAFILPLISFYPVEFIILVLLTFALMKVRAPLKLMFLALLVFLTISALPSTRMYVFRNFFGLAFVYDGTDPQTGERFRFLTTGEGLQSSQLLDPDPVAKPVRYLKPLVPLFTARPFKEVGMIGLGAGMALCLTAPDRHFTVYEIDPKFRRIAEEHFTFIRDCGEPAWRMGDGRLELEKDADRRYDALIIDAFQHINIPLHLINREALALYRARVKPDGIILYNLNNLHYDLFPQVAAQAAEAGWQAWRLEHTWILLAPPGLNLEWLRLLGWYPETRHASKVWSDDFSNVLSALTKF